MNQFDFSANQFLSQSLQKRQEQNALRRLVINNQLTDFCSNDYLGFARSETLQKNISLEYSTLIEPSTGSTGSRLLAGNSEYAERLEKQIAIFHNAEAGLIYNSGYDANLGLIASIAQRGDTIIYDELIHASIHDGMKLSAASTYLFKHNDLEHLEERFKIAQGIVYVIVESIYSMDGDYAPLIEIVALWKKYKANLVVDEAHATGVTMNGGKGRVQELNLEKEIFARVHTFGKALGCHGAIVLGSTLLRDFLINFSRSFIYTTALPVKNLMAINQSYRLLQANPDLSKRLQQLIFCFKNNIAKYPFIELIESNTPIQCVVINGNNKVKQVAIRLQSNNFDVRPILSPTVPKGKERLRICIHLFNNEQEVINLVKLVASALADVQ